MTPPVSSMTSRAHPPRLRLGLVASARVFPPQPLHVHSTGPTSSVLAADLPDVLQIQVGGGTKPLTRGTLSGRSYGSPGPYAVAGW